MGGLGCPAALARRRRDARGAPAPRRSDRVERSTFPADSLHEADVGQPKAEVAARRLSRLVPGAGRAAGAPAQSGIRSERSTDATCCSTARIRSRRASPPNDAACAAASVGPRCRAGLGRSVLHHLPGGGSCLRCLSRARRRPARCPPAPRRASPRPCAEWSAPRWLRAARVLRGERPRAVGRLHNGTACVAQSATCGSRDRSCPAARSRRRPTSGILEEGRFQRMPVIVKSRRRLRPLTRARSEVSVENAATVQAAWRTCRAAYRGLRSGCSTTRERSAAT